MRCRWSRIQCLSPRLRSSLEVGYCSWRWFYLARRLSDSDVFVCTTVIKKPEILLRNQALDEHYVGDLADFLPFFFRGEDGGVGTGEQLARVSAVEEGNARAVGGIVVRAVVNEEEALLWGEWGGGRVDDGGVKTPV